MKSLNSSELNLTHTQTLGTISTNSALNVTHPIPKQEKPLQKDKLNFAIVTEAEEEFTKRTL